MNTPALKYMEILREKAKIMSPWQVWIKNGLKYYVISIDADKVRACYFSKKTGNLMASNVNIYTFLSDAEFFGDIDISADIPEGLEWQRKNVLL